MTKNPVGGLSLISSTPKKGAGSDPRETPFQGPWSRGVLAFVSGMQPVILI